MNALNYQRMWWILCWGIVFNQPTSNNERWLTSISEFRSVFSNHGGFILEGTYEVTTGCIHWQISLSSAHSCWTLLGGRHCHPLQLLPRHPRLQHEPKPDHLGSMKVRPLALAVDMTMNYQELASFWGNPVPSCDPYTLVVGGNSDHDDPWCTMLQQQWQVSLDGPAGALCHYSAASFSPQTHALPPASVATANNVTWHYPGSVNSQQLRLPNEAAVLPRRKLWKMSAELAHQRSSTISPQDLDKHRCFHVTILGQQLQYMLPSDMGLPTFPAAQCMGLGRLTPILLTPITAVTAVTAVTAPRPPKKKAWARWKNKKVWLS